MKSVAKDRWSALIVDDEPLARASLRKLLEREADTIHILEARNGHEAVSLIASERPDVVFLDVQMPEMDGFEVVRQVGAAAMPDVIFVTANRFGDVFLPQFAPVVIDHQRSHYPCALYLRHALASCFGIRRSVVCSAAGDKSSG